MRKHDIAAVVVFASSLIGCISAERKAEYVEWLASEDGEGFVSLETFESEYRQGWRDRAEQKKDRLVREEEYSRWLESDDKVDGVTLEVFEQKYRAGWEARAEQKTQVRLAREAAERVEKERLAMRTALYEKAVEHDLAAIRDAYARGRKYGCLFPRKTQCDDWLNTWADSRLGLSEEDKLAGEALLSEFGNKYLPNAYANYEKKRDALAELQQIFNEEFSQPWTIKSTDPKWNSFNKVLEKFVKARTEFFICHDELCHYWLLSRFGVLADKDFVQIDEKPLAVHLLPENVERAGYTLMEVAPLESKIADFAVKYAPESNAIYQKMGREFKELDALLSEVSKQRIQLDDVRHNRVLAAAVAKRNDLVREMNTLSLQLQTWCMDHKTTEKSSEEVAKCDVAMSKRLKPFMDVFPTYIKEHSLGPIIANSEMIVIPGQRYRMQRTEVTQLQWMMVMGNNPSKFRGPDRPVECVSWDDCQEFIKRASVLDGVKYRLPTGEEWEYACRAGSTSDWGKRMNGECGPLETMGWCDGNSGTHAVAAKEPNAWGLFDMHGNVEEWCEDLYKPNRSERVYRGGGWGHSNKGCTASRCNYGDSDRRSTYLGFRLAVSQE